MFSKNRKLSRNLKDALLIEMNKEIAESSNNAIESIMNGNYEDYMTYPPDWEFTEEEKTALSKLKSIHNIKTALMKIISNASSFPLFNLFNIIDGTGDIESVNIKYDGFSLLDSEDNDEEDFLHDDFYEKYWDWKKIHKKTTE